MTHTKWFNEDGSRMACSRENCQRPVHVSGLCARHYSSAWKKGQQPPSLHYTFKDGTRMKCCQLDCEREVKARGLCQMHYARVLNSGKPRKKWRQTKWTNSDGTRMLCMDDGCNEPIKTNGKCQFHYDREWRLKNRPNTMKVCPVPGCGRPMIKKSSICGACNSTRWRYNLDYKTYIELRKPENYKCGNPACGSTTHLHLDHDHKCCDNRVKSAGDKVSCGRCIRGWLCLGCNTSLGKMRDDPRMLEGLLQYLQKSKTPEA